MSTLAEAEKIAWEHNRLEEHFRFPFHDREATPPPNYHLIFTYQSSQLSTPPNYPDLYASSDPCFVFCKKKQARRPTLERELFPPVWNPKLSYLEETLTERKRWEESLKKKLTQLKKSKRHRRYYIRLENLSWKDQQDYQPYPYQPPILPYNLRKKRLSSYKKFL